MSEPGKENISIQRHLQEASSEMTHDQIRNTDATQRGSVVTDDACYVIGIDIGGSNLRLALADMNGAIEAKWTCSTVGMRNADDIIQLIKDGVRHLLGQVSAANHSLKAIAAGVPGITDVDAGVVIATSYLVGWRNVPLRALLEDAFSAPVAIDNDVNLAALGEGWAGAAKGTSDFVFLAIGTGIGAGIVLNGLPFRGTSWAAGEIGYMLVPGAPDFAGNRGEPGALESMIGGEGIRAQWQRYRHAENSTFAEDLTATEIFDCALSGDASAQNVLQQTAVALSRAIYNIALVLNCNLFVLGGSVGMHQALYDATQTVVKQLNMRGQPQLVRSAFGVDAQLIGALRLALDTAKAFPASVLRSR
jgi:glucokinase